jgi:hypothetical protein
MRRGNLSDSTVSIIASLLALGVPELRTQIIKHFLSFFRVWLLASEVVKALTLLKRKDEATG